MINTILNKLELLLEEFKLLSPEEKRQYRYISLACPISSPISLIPVSAEQYFYINKPNSGICVLGLGSLINVTSTGEKRFSTINDKYSKIIKKWYQKDKNCPSSIQSFMAFAFDENDSMTGKWDGFPNTTLSIPEILIKESLVREGKSQGKKVQTLEVNITLYNYQSNQQKNPQTSPQTNPQRNNEDLYYQQIFNSIKKQLNNYITLINQTSTEKESVFDSSVYKSKDKNNWKALTQEAITRIQKGDFEKIVTSHCQSHQIEEGISIAQLIENLKTHYPSCTIVSYQANNKIIVAASPERLFSLNNQHIESDAIGGTIKKPDKDKVLFNFKPDLEISKKLLIEHRFISHDIYQRLDPLCNTLKMPVSPLLMMLHNMYHLETSIEGTLKPQHDFFNLLETLHPTPAVAGFPSTQAKHWLIENETYNRGWYSGAFGLVDSHFNGEISVMLRCALINDNKIDLFAGAGLVAESDPEIEWQEVEIKMHTILDQL